MLSSEHSKIKPLSAALPREGPLWVVVIGELTCFLGEVSLSGTASDSSTKGPVPSATEPPGKGQETSSEGAWGGRGDALEEGHAAEAAPAAWGRQIRCRPPSTKRPKGSLSLVAAARRCPAPAQNPLLCVSGICWFLWGTVRRRPGAERAAWGGFPRGAASCLQTPPPLGPAAAGGKGQHGPATSIRELRPGPDALRLPAPGAGRGLGGSPVKWKQIITIQG